MSLTTTWKSKLLHSPLIPEHPDISNYASQIDSAASSHSGMALKHISLAYDHYSALSKHEQQQIWQIELARAFASEKQKRAEVQDSLEAVMAEARQLNGQVEYLSRCQWPREMALWPPERRPIRKSLVRELESDTLRSAKRRRTIPSQTGGADIDGHHSDPDYDEEEGEEEEEEKRWDYDTRLSKWKKIVREDSLRKRGLTLPLPHAPVLNTPLSAGGGITTTAAGPSITTNHTSLSSSNLTSITTATSVPTTVTALLPAPRPSAAASTAPIKKKKKEDASFEPWSEKLKFVKGENCMIGIPISVNKQPQRHQQSNLRDLVDGSVAQTDHSPASIAAAAAAAEREGQYRRGYAYANANGNREPSQVQYPSQSQTQSRFTYAYMNGDANAIVHQGDGLS